MIDQLQAAIELARTSPFIKQRVGCIITDKRGRVLAKGINTFKSHPLQAHYARLENLNFKIYLHAEVAALVKVRTKGAIAFIARVKPNGETGLSRPCPICMLALKEAGIKKIVYTDNFGSYRVELI